MTRDEFLLDMLEYYVPDPVNRRCVNENEECRYSPVTFGIQDRSEGCAIGRKLSPELAKEIDDAEGSIGIEDVLGRYELPEYMNDDNSTFLRKCQVLHDLNEHWDTGLSEKGIDKVICIIDEFKLNKELFTKFLN